jgi:hypothetical protein
MFTLTPSTIIKPHTIKFPGLTSSGMSKSSPQILGRTEPVECAEAIAIMVIRFTPEDKDRYYTAHEMALSLTDMPNGHLSTFHVEVDALKKALSNEILRQALLSILHNRFEFLRSSTQFDIRTKSPFAFRRGYQIMFSVHSENKWRRTCRLCQDYLFKILYQIAAVLLRKFH